MSPWRGQLDTVNHRRVSGWAQALDAPDRAVELRILDDGVVVAELVANEYRADLKSAGIGDGRHAFSFAVPGGFAPDRPHIIVVQRADNGDMLPGSPYALGPLEPNSQEMDGTQPSAWRGNLDVVTRERIEGWVWDEKSPQHQLTLVIRSNGEVIARVLAKEYRKDLEDAGVGDGRHGFSVVLPVGLSPLNRHVVQIVGQADGREMPGSPVTIEPSMAFDAILEDAISNAVSATMIEGDRERALAFFAAQIERLSQVEPEVATKRKAGLVNRLLSDRRKKSDEQNLVGLSASRPPRALVIDDAMPAVGRDAGSNVIFSHISALQKLGYEVSFIAADELSPSAETTEELKARGILCCCLSPYCSSVEEVLRRQRDVFEVIYLHRVRSAAKYLAMASQYCPKAHTVFSVAELHHLRLTRQAKAQGRPGLMEDSRRLRLAECSATCSADIVITHSSFEAGWLRQAVMGSNVHVVPWSIPIAPTSRPWSQRYGVAFVANFDHAPNVDAAQYLVSSVMPRVWEGNSTIECLLVGSQMPDSIASLNIPGIVVMGYVPDLATIYDRVRLTVAPLRFGAGVKGQVLDSLAAGLPCVMTPIAAEGIALPDILAGAIGVDAAALASQILRLHDAEAELQSMAQAGREFISTGYTDELVVNALKAALDSSVRSRDPDSAPS